jgi:hypothetical protein
MRLRVVTQVSGQQRRPFAPAAEESHAGDRVLCFERLPEGADIRVCISEMWNVLFALKKRANASCKGFWRICYTRGAEPI